ncbi:hypothetical protein ScPMuIL_011841 [Solemya velum]
MLQLIRFAQTDVTVDPVRPNRCYSWSGSPKQMLQLIRFAQTDVTVDLNYDAFWDSAHDRTTAVDGIRGIKIAIQHTDELENL